MRFSPSCSAAKFLFFGLNRSISTATRFTGDAGSDRKRTTMLTSLIRLLHQWKQYNRSLNELSRLGDRELADIGISRSDIHAVAWQSAHKG